MAAVITKQLLAGIRLVNGGLALTLPNVVGGRLGVNTTTSPGLGYAFRLFGVRTVLIGIQLWRTPAIAGNQVIQRDDTDPRRRYRSCSRRLQDGRAATQRRDARRRHLRGEHRAGGASELAGPADSVMTDLTADYVVVGSGAGGGPLAVRLAAAGHTVIVIEAGGMTGPSDLAYEVPGFHAYASEAESMTWSYFVQHYDNRQQAERDPKYRADLGGVLYPRCATVGGCTAHNAMIIVRPNNADWDDIAALTSDKPGRRKP